MRFIPIQLLCLTLVLVPISGCGDDKPQPTPISETEISEGQTVSDSADDWENIRKSAIDYSITHKLILSVEGSSITHLDGMLFFVRLDGRSASGKRRVVNVLTQKFYKSGGSSYWLTSPLSPTLQDFVSLKTNSRQMNNAGTKALKDAEPEPEPMDYP